MQLPRTLPAALLFAACLALPIAARAQAYPTMANQPDPSDFVRRTESQLTLLGQPFRFGGVTVTWLGRRQDGAAPSRRPTKYEVTDALETAAALGASVLRVPGLADTAGCALCLEPQPGQFDDGAFAQIDLVLATARDLGLKVIVPLADSGRDCAPNAVGVICGAARVAGAADGRAFFTDARLTTAFTTRIRRILDHRNGLTGTLYRNDPTILAWEDCDGCASIASVPMQAVAVWTESLGQTIKGADAHHLYESGAFAGHIGRTGRPAVAPSVYAPASVDIVGDRLLLGSDPEAARLDLTETAAGVTRSGHAYLLDSFGWSPSQWKTISDLDVWLSAVTRTRTVSGALTGNLQAHADQGGNLPAPPAAGPGLAALYFPGVSTPDVDLPTMQDRGRSLRRFNYAMSDVTLTPPYLLSPKPEVLSAARGRVVWRGAAGAAFYTIERSPDPGQPFSWTVVCDAQATDAAGFWQDPNPVAGAWYRVMPLNINLHRAEPSEPFQGQ